MTRSLAIMGLIIASLLAGLLWLYTDASRDRARLRDQIEAMHRAATADEAYLKDLAEDAREQAKTEKELHNAISQTPDSSPDAVRVRLGCQRLWRQGTDISTIPACRGAGGGE